MPNRDQHIAALTRALVAVEAVISPLQILRLELLDLLLLLRPQVPAPPDPCTCEVVRGRGVRREPTCVIHGDGVLREPPPV
jgi:hypothetical protein